MKKSILTFTLMLALALFTWSCSDNDSDTEQAYEKWLDAIRHDAEREYEMGDVSEQQIAEFLDSIS